MKEHGGAAPKIESERLVITPAENGEIRALSGGEKDAELKKAYSEMLDLCEKHPDDRLWYTVWLIAAKSAPQDVVGDLCFKGLNGDGSVEIGYGLRDGFCGRGYMTEAVRAIVKWAFSQRGVDRIEAETEPDNAASQKVLFRVGFVPTGTIGEEGPRFVLRGGSVL